MLTKPAYLLLGLSANFSSIFMFGQPLRITALATRRTFLSLSALAAFQAKTMETTEKIKLGLTGDVMIGRAIDAILPYRVDGKLYEGYCKHADHYVELAVRENGPLPMKEIQGKGFAYIWGNLIPELRDDPDCLIVNLETSLTENDKPAPKGINYRAHPKNVQSLNEAGVKVATLANNHVLDWREEGLIETLETLEHANIPFTGAGRDIASATKPAVVPIQVGNDLVHVKVLAVGFPSAGVPPSWRATQSSCGVNVEEEASLDAAQRILDYLSKEDPSTKTAETETELVNEKDIKVVSLHWGPNWGWGTPKTWRKFAHALIDQGVDIVVGHSSHHVKGLEVYKGKLIAYGLGDFLNDYEGITGQGYELFRDDLACLYLPSLDIKTGKLTTLDIVPCKIHHLRVQRATDPDDIEWIRNTLTKEGKILGTSCKTYKDSKGNTNLRIEW